MKLTKRELEELSRFCESLKAIAIESPQLNTVQRGLKALKTSRIDRIGLKELKEKHSVK